MNVRSDLTGHTFLKVSSKVRAAALFNAAMVFVLVAMIFVERWKLHPPPLSSSLAG